MKMAISSEMVSEEDGPRTAQTHLHKAGLTRRPARERGAHSHHQDLDQNGSGIPKKAEITIAAECEVGEAELAYPHCSKFRKFYTP